MAHEQPQKQPNKKRDFIALRLNIPTKLDKRLEQFKIANGLVSKAVAAVKILETRLYPVSNHVE